MSRWLQRLSSESRRRRALEDSNSPKRKVHAESLKSNRTTTQCHSSTIFPSSDNQLTDREEELCRRSYQLVVWKLQLSERETSLTQKFEYLTREKTRSPEAAEAFEEQLNIMLAEWDDIREIKARLAERHQHLEIAIEMLIADKERLVK